MDELTKIDTEMMFTIDPETGLPALTTLLYKVCGDDTKKFNEACRLVKLFMLKAKETK